MKKYTHPEMNMTELNALDVITVSSLKALDPISPTVGGSDPSMEDQID